MTHPTRIDGHRPDGTAGVDFHVPFDGRGSSSRGPREQGAAACEFRTTPKTAHVAAGGPRP
ncbi:hypothetical protein [Streptomyces griseoruber]|uniref:hypothetical protein n=1 Tax=Streptomyces griseoruber TaxID=1943 RepID=UPI0037881935